MPESAKENLGRRKNEPSLKKLTNSLKITGVKRRTKHHGNIGCCK